MAIKIVISDTLKFTVKGSIKNAAGIDEPFTFQLTTLRLDAEAIQARLQADNEASLADFFADLVEDWHGVKDADDKPMPYSHAGLKQLFRIPGIAALTFRTYLSEVGAKEKN